MGRKGVHIDSERPALLHDSKWVLIMENIAMKNSETGEDCFSVSFREHQLGEQTTRQPGQRARVDDKDSKKHHVFQQGTRATAVDYVGSDRRAFDLSPCPYSWLPPLPVLLSDQTEGRAAEAPGRARARRKNRSAPGSSRVEAVRPDGRPRTNHTQHCCQH